MVNDRNFGNGLVGSLKRSSGFFSSGPAVVYLCAALGGFVAAIADLVQKEEASAVAKITLMFARHLQVTLQPIWILLMLVILAVSLCFVFQPSDRRQSFVTGMGVIAIIMTVTPYRQPNTGLPAFANKEKTAAIGDEALYRLVGDEYGNSLEFPNVFPSGDNPSKSNGWDGVYSSNIFYITVRNFSHSPVSVSVRLLFSETGMQLYQKNISHPDQEIVLPFQIDEQYGDKFKYVIGVNGFDLSSKEVATLSLALDKPPVVNVFSDRLVLTDDGGYTEIFDKKALESTFPKSVKEKIFSNFSW